MKNSETWKKVNLAQHSRLTGLFNLKEKKSQHHLKKKEKKYTSVVFAKLSHTHLPVVFSYLHLGHPIYSFSSLYGDSSVWLAVGVSPLLICVWQQICSVHCLGLAAWQ